MKVEMSPSIKSARAPLGLASARLPGGDKALVANALGAIRSQRIAPGTGPQPILAAGPEPMPAYELRAGTPEFAAFVGEAEANAVPVAALIAASISFIARNPYLLAQVAKEVGGARQTG
jgi:hypothetical protein